MSAKTDAFIAKYKDAVIQSSRGTGLFPSVTMAQMIIESSWGEGITAQQANNFFGIKADAGWTGPKKLFSTPRDAKPQNYFRVYSNPKDSILDHEHFLMQNSRYQTHGVFAAKTPDEQAKDIAAAGYAEAPDYANTLIHLIDAYNLRDLDREAVNSPTVIFATNHLPEIIIGSVLIVSALFYLITLKHKTT